MALQEQVARARADIAEAKRVQDGGIVLLKLVVQMLNDLKDKVADPAALAALDEAIATLEQNTQAFADDLAANTPADPAAPPPSPEPAPPGGPTPMGGAIPSGRPITGGAAQGVSGSPLGPRPRTPVR